MKWRKPDGSTTSQWYATQKLRLQFNTLPGLYLTLLFMPRAIFFPRWFLGSAR